jgi:hypothetical protein
MSLMAAERPANGGLLRVRDQSPVSNSGPSHGELPIVSGGHLKSSRFWETAAGDWVRSARHGPGCSEIYQILRYDWWQIGNVDAALPRRAYSATHPNFSPCHRRIRNSKAACRSGQTTYLQCYEPMAERERWRWRCKCRIRDVRADDFRFARCSADNHRTTFPLCVRSCDGTLVLA